MIIIQGLAFFFGHIFRIHTVQINWRISDRFKIHKLPITVLYTFAADQLVLSANTVASFNINTRFIGGNHSLFEYSAIPPFRHNLPAETIGSLVHVEQISDAVASTAFIIQMQIPNGTAGQNIQIDPNTAMQKLCIRQIQIAAQNSSKMQLLLFRNRAQHHGASNISSALIILTARQSTKSIPSGFSTALDSSVAE